MTIFIILYLGIALLALGYWHHEVFDGWDFLMLTFLCLIWPICGLVMLGMNLRRWND